jgi:hypothetical protein
VKRPPKGAKEAREWARSTCEWCGKRHLPEVVCGPREDWEERAAILEYDAGLKREEAERKAQESIT